MNIVEELKAARPEMIKQVMLKTGCDEKQAESAVDRTTKKRLDTVVNATADKLIGEKINRFYSSEFER